VPDHTGEGTCGRACLKTPYCKVVLGCAGTINVECNINFLTMMRVVSSLAPRTAPRTAHTYVVMHVSSLLAVLSLTLSTPPHACRAPKARSSASCLLESTTTSRRRQRWETAASVLEATAEERRRFDHRAHLATLIGIYVTNKVHAASESETELIVAMQRTLACSLAIHSHDSCQHLSFAVPIPQTLGSRPGRA